MNATSLLPLHYLINDTMRPLAKRYFLPSIPAGFICKEHSTETSTSGNFGQDNYYRLLEERTNLILHEIETQLDDGLMVWCDVDVVFFGDCADELVRLADGKDLLFQREIANRAECNFGIQVIRRNVKTLAFYARLLLGLEVARLMPKASFGSFQNSGNDQPLGNWLLSLSGAPQWGHLPLSYSSESNGRCRLDSVLYHANSTINNSITSKFEKLNAALAFRACHDGGQKRFDAAACQAD